MLRVQRVIFISLRIKPMRKSRFRKATQLPQAHTDNLSSQQDENQSSLPGPLGLTAGLSSPVPQTALTSWRMREHGLPVCPLRTAERQERHPAASSSSKRLLALPFPTSHIHHHADLLWKCQPSGGRRVKIQGGGGGGQGKTWPAPNPNYRIASDPLLGSHKPTPPHNICTDCPYTHAGLEVGNRRGQSSREPSCRFSMLLAYRGVHIDQHTGSRNPDPLLCGLRDQHEELDAHAQIHSR